MSAVAVDMMYFALAMGEGVRVPEPLEDVIPDYIERGDALRKREARRMAKSGGDDLSWPTFGHAESLRAKLEFLSAFRKYGNPQRLPA